MVMLILATVNINGLKENITHSNISKLLLVFRVVPYVSDAVKAPDEKGLS